MTVANERVTLVILTHDRRDELCRVIDRARALPERPRIIVVDNASEDGTREIVSACFPDVELVRLEQNRGAAGRNAGVLAATTPYVALSDDDAWWSPGALSRAADLLDEYPVVAIVTAAVRVGAAEREDAACREMVASPLPRRADVPGVPVFGFLAGACVVRRSAFLDVGGFEPRFFLGGEEQLLAIDLVMAGWHLAYASDVVAYHHPSPRRDVRRRRRLLIRNALWVAWLRRPPMSALRQTVRLLARAAGDPKALPGWFQAFAALRWILRDRRVVPDEVERGLQAIEADR